MKTGVLSLLAGTALMGAVAAQAGEPIILDSSQLDRVAAGSTISMAVTAATGLTTAGGATSTSTVSDGDPTSTSGGGNNGNLTLAVSAPTFGGPSYTIVHAAP